MSSRIKGIIDAVSDLAMDYSARMARAKEQGFDFADSSSRDGIDYASKAMRDGDPQAQAFSQYLSDNNIPYKPHVARTGSTYIDVLGDPYKLRDGGYSQSPLQYRFADHSKGKFGQDSYLGTKHIDSTMEADVFPSGNTLEQAIAKLEDTPGVRSRDAAFDPARRFDKNYLASVTGAGLLGGSMFASEDADAGILKGIIDAVPDLARDHQSRMARANDIDIDTRAQKYHGTGNLEGFEQFDPLMTGKGADQYGPGFYLSTSPHQASGFADGMFRGRGLPAPDSPGVLPLYSRTNNLMEVDGRSANHLGDVLNLKESQVRGMLDQSSALKRSVDNEDMNPLGDYYESFWSEGADDWMLDDLAAQYAGRNPEELTDLFADNGEFLTALSDATGFDGLNVKFSDDLANEIHWKPENIRSTSAQFDPAKKDSSNLLASVAGTGLLGGSMLASENASANGLDMQQQGSLLDSLKQSASAVGESMIGGLGGILGNIDDSLTYGNPRASIGRAITPEQLQQRTRAIETTPGLVDSPQFMSIDELELMRNREKANTIRDISGLITSLVSPI